ncbi:hypothetical protein IWQ60_004762 [Tieghemiomyces parasiticus]|uniref:Centromere protein M n=1 Tax=Tieghemiomyces parasiticus TaxID=78921 RepID=A0A9W8A7K7_9FUNG|nr:hypothetical protein IWQ60_004762 [Tieghemiomyces parasiticus]
MVASTATTLEAMVSHPGFDLYPSGSSARPRAWHLMFVGAQGSGKRTVAAALHRHRFDGPYRPRVTVHTSSALPLGDGSSLPPGDSSRASAPSPARHMDYAVLFLDLTNQAALDDLRQHLALVPPAYFLGRLCILATHYDQRPQHAFGIEDLEAVVDALYDVPIHYINTQVNNVLGELDNQCFHASRLAAAHEIADD